MLLVDGGDLYQGMPVSNMSKGAAVIAALDAMDYDAVALGNHEFDWGVSEYCADADATLPAYRIGVLPATRKSRFWPAISILRTRRSVSPLRETM